MLPQELPPLQTGLWQEVRGGNSLHTRETCFGRKLEPAVDENFCPAPEYGEILEISLRSVNQVPASVRALCLMGQGFCAEESIIPSHDEN